MINTPIQNYMVIKIDETRLTNEDVNPKNPNKKCRHTYGRWFLKYGREKGRKTFEYRIFSDIFAEGSKRFKDFAELMEKAKKDEELMFVVKNTNVDAHMFKLAKHNIGILLPLNFDVVRYAQKLGYNQVSGYMHLFITEEDMESERYRQMIRARMKFK